MLACLMLSNKLVSLSTKTKSRVKLRPEIANTSLLSYQRKFNIIAYVQHLPKLCLMGNLACVLSSADFFSKKLTFSKNSFSNTIRVPNGLYPDQDRQCRSWSGSKPFAITNISVSKERVKWKRSTLQSKIQRLWFNSMYLETTKICVTGSPM